MFRQPMKILCAMAATVATAALALSTPGCAAPELGETPPIEPVPPACEPDFAGGLCVPQGSAIASSAQRAAVTEALAVYLERELSAAAELVAGPVPSCQASALDGYLHAQRALGGAALCLETVEACLDQVEDGAVAASLAFRGGQCAADMSAFERAYQLFDRATAAESIELAGHAGRVFAFAYFAVATQYEGELDAILARHLPWSENNTVVRQTVVYLLTGLLEHNSGAPGFIHEHMEGADEVLREHLVALYWMPQARNAGDWVLTFAYTNRDRLGLPLATMRAPHRFVGALFQALYSGEGGDFTLARQLYDVYAPYAAANAWLPMESNPYTYTELYAVHCSSVLSQGSALIDYLALLDDWRAGLLSGSQALTRAEELQAAGERADVSTFSAGVHQVMGDLASAEADYLRAHQLCPYYNRAHWGLRTLRRDHFQRALADRQSLLDDMRAQIANAPLDPAAVEAFLEGAGVFDPAVRERVLFSVLVWAPHLEMLVQSESTLYIKESFELLSQVPALEAVRDLRVPFARDHRLYDDLRGAGGNPVVSDRSEAASAVFGALNVSAHEVAHRFHAVAPDNIRSCITELYLQARAANSFTDSYAATNEQEYFAQGVTFYTVPADAPIRYGLTRERVAEVDPALLTLIQSIADASAPLPAIACPKVSPARRRAVPIQVPPPHGPRVLRSVRERTPTRLARIQQDRR